MKSHYYYYYLITIDKWCQNRLAQTQQKLERGIILDKNVWIGISLTFLNKIRHCVYNSCVYYKKLHGVSYKYTSDANS